MKKLLLIIIALSLLAQAGEYALIIAKQSSVKSVSSKLLKGIFLHKRNFIDGVKVIPVNILSGQKARDNFEQNILKMSKDKLNRYWIKQHFQGVKPPVTQSSFESIKLFVQNVEGAIGYIPKDLVDSKVKIIYEF